MAFTRGQALVGLSFTLINVSTGAAVTTGTATGYVTLDGGTQTAIAGSPVHEGNGQWTVDLTAAEMDGALVGLLITHPLAINVDKTLQTETTAAAASAATPAFTLSTLDALKLQMGHKVCGDDVALAVFLSGADRAVRTYLRRGQTATAFTAWPLTGSDTEYYSGSGRRDQCLRYGPVTAITSMYLDNAGHFGDGPSAFAASTLLTVGRDYALVKDDGTASASAMVRRLAGHGAPGIWDDDWSPWGRGSGRGGLLAGRRHQSWPYTSAGGNIKITYTAGYTTVPADIQLAVNMMAAFMFANRERGMPMQSESLADYSFSLMSSSANLGNEFGTIASLLARYRTMVI